MEPRDTVASLATLLQQRVDHTAIDVRADELGIDLVTRGTPSATPGLAIQVLAAHQTRADRSDVLLRYEEHGVPEVWVVSTGRKTIEIRQRKSGYFTTTAMLRKGTLKPIAFPDIALEISEIWPQD